MPSGTEPSEVSRPAKRGGTLRTMAAVDEVPVWLEINRCPAVTWMCTPDLLEELAIGWLAGEGYVNQLEDVHLRPCATDLGFWAEVDPERVQEVEHSGRRAVLASGCGAVSTFLADPETLPRRPATTHHGPPDQPTLRALFKTLFGRGIRYREAGGIHAAALVDGSDLHFHAEDIGRHNAVDKVVGAAILARQSLDAKGLLVTGRISAELAAKAARAGMAWVATPSIPSTLAVDIARRSGMWLVGRAVSGDPHRHAPS